MAGKQQVAWRDAACLFLSALASICCLAGTAPAFAQDDSGGGGRETSSMEWGKLDLNRASLEEVLALPIPERVARNIIEYRDFVRYFADVYDLMDVRGMTGEWLKNLKPLVATLPPPEQAADIARLSASYRQVRRFLGQEGANEGLVDEYLDMMRMPHNINELDLFDLQSFQNVSPVDAAAILRARERLGRFENSRQLRRSDGLRYWAFRNLRDFVVYSDAEESAIDARRLRGDYQLRYYDTPYFVDNDDVSRAASIQTIGRFMVADELLPKPAMTNKLRVRLTRRWGAGVLTHRNLGDDSWYETTKGFVGTQDHWFGPFHLKRLVVGNYRASFGLGLVMDNTDFIVYRKTGFGWNKRLLGIRTDLSRSREYALFGVGLEGSISRFHISLFGSSARKDAVLNPDGTINRHVVMHPRLSQDWINGRDVANPDLVRRDAFKENILGGNLKYMLSKASYIGVTGYNAQYDKPWDSDVASLVADLDQLQARDSEIAAGYTSVFENPDAGVVESHKFRRVLGAEFQTVQNNFSLQAEYAFMQDPRNTLFSTKNPDALIVNGFMQWENLHLLAIYRDRDLFYDNPYDRSFSNDNRYEQTLLDAPYRLNDDLYTWLELYTPQPKPEQGLFFDARYRISRNLILTGFQFDQWKRKADDADLMRYTIKGEFQPIFNLRLRVRHRFSSRSEQNPDDVRAYRNWETRWQLIAMLSNYNRVAFMYMTSNVMFPARPRLGAPAEAGPNGSAVGLAADPGRAFEVRYEHNITPGITFYAASTVYDGFVWNFEGNEFVLLDGTGFRNWIKFESRVSERLLMQLKVTRDHNLPRTFVDIREFGAPSGNEPDATYVPIDNTHVRLQIDYLF